MSGQELKVFDTFDRSYRQYKQTEQSIKTYQDVLHAASKGYHDHHHDDDDDSKNVSDDEDVSKRYTDGNDVVSKRYLDDFEVLSKPNTHQEDEKEQQDPVEDEIDIIKKKLKFRQFQTPNPKRYNDDINLVTKPYTDTFRQEMGPPAMSRDVYDRQRVPEIERLEKMLSEIKEKKVDKEFSKDKFTETLIDNLYSQITFLKQQVVTLNDNNNNDNNNNNNILGEHSDNITISSSSSGGESSNADSPIPSSSDSFLPPVLVNKRNRINLSQHLDSDDSEKSDEVDEATLKTKELTKLRTNYVPLPKHHYIDTDSPLLQKKKRVGNESVLGSKKDLLTEVIGVHHTEVLLSDDDDVVVADEVFSTAPANRMNERWQAAVIFMVVMSFTILVCCLVPIVLLPK